jgi:hypothetical protein
MSANQPIGPPEPGSFHGYGQYVPARLGGPADFGLLTYTPAPDGTPGRVRFVSKKEKLYFDVPVQELHSVALADYNTTLEFWHGDLRHRVCLLPGGVTEANLTGEFRGATEAQNWQALLTPMVGQKPEGVKVRPPMSKGKRIALNWGLGCGISLVIIVIVFIVVLATSL